MSYLLTRVPVPDRFPAGLASLSSTTSIFFLIDPLPFQINDILSLSVCRGSEKKKVDPFPSTLSTPIFPL